MLIYPVNTANYNGPTLQCYGGEPNGRTIIFHAIDNILELPQTNIHDVVGIGFGEDIHIVLLEKLASYSSVDQTKHSLMVSFKTVW